jgi:3-methyladenine DNA glycosylase Tag
MRAVRFKTIHARAAKRKGGEKALAKLLGPVPPKQALLKLADDRVLAEMARRVFCAGFVWQVIDAKWKGFEAAFLGFNPAKLVHQPDEFWEKLTSDKRIVRNGQKIMSVRANALFVRDIAAQHGSFGKFLAGWPAQDQVGLLQLLKKRGNRLGGMTGQYLLRFLGWDGFVTSRDVVACLRDCGLEIADMPSTGKDLAKVQAQFNAWAEESGLPRSRISRICALSIGENYDAATLKQRMGGED